MSEDEKISIEREEKRIALEIEHKTKVHLFEFRAGEKDKAALYVKEPDRYVKMKAIDVSQDSYTSAASLVFQSCAIQEASDSRFFDEKVENDSLYLGAIMQINELVQYIVADVKKK